MLNRRYISSEKYFPQFDIKLQPTDFRIGDDIQMVDSSGTTGEVSAWNNSSKYLTVESNNLSWSNNRTNKIQRERINIMNNMPNWCKGIIKKK